jgi:hypothetical protein
MHILMKCTVQEAKTRLTVFVSKTKDKGCPIRRLEGTERVVEITLLMVKLSTGWRCVVSATPWPLYPLERDTVRMVQQAGWGPWLVWVGVVKRKSLNHYWGSTPNCPVK